MNCNFSRVLCVKSVIIIIIYNPSWAWKWVLWVLRYFFKWAQTWWCKICALLANNLLSSRPLEWNHTSVIFNVYNETCIGSNCKIQIKIISAFVHCYWWTFHLNFIFYMYICLKYNIIFNHLHQMHFNLHIKYFIIFMNVQFWLFSYFYDSIFIQDV